MLHLVCEQIIARPLKVMNVAAVGMLTLNWINLRYVLIIHQSTDIWNHHVSHLDSSNSSQQELPKEEISRMVKDSEGDVRYLIQSIHHRSDLRKKVAEKAHNSVPSSSQKQTAKPRPFPVPDGIPKTQEELAEEEEALMPESPYTRLLRRMGRYPDWYTPRPDHETDWIKSSTIQVSLFGSSAAW